jgi:pimeloyl-ACP methyl ester carboxylesterase
VRGALAGAPAPRLINVHGGIHPTELRSKDFAKFLAGLGYPESAVRHPGNGAYSISCYENAEMLAGIIAWYYEREGLRPVIFGHSQGGMQAVKTLQLLAKPRPDSLAVWSPLTWKAEARTEITDPLTGKRRPVAGLVVPYTAALAAGGVTRALPNQWDIMTSLRDVPDTVEDFTGFYLNFDLLGGDFLGFGSANHFRATGRARVRNVHLPPSSVHTLPDFTPMLGNRQAITWIYNYVQTGDPKEPAGIQGDIRGIVMAADVWKSMRKHWVMELQRLIRTRRAGKYVR